MNFSSIRKRLERIEARQQVRALWRREAFTDESGLKWERMGPVVNGTWSYFELPAKLSREAWTVWAKAQNERPEKLKALARERWLERQRQTTLH